jgi:hypothetical protein
MTELAQTPAPELKQIVIKGAAAESYKASKGGAPKRTRRRARPHRGEEDELDEESLPQIPLAKAKVTVSKTMSGGALHPGTVPQNPRSELLPAVAAQVKANTQPEPQVLPPAKPLPSHHPELKETPSNTGSTVSAATAPKQIGGKHSLVLAPAKKKTAKGHLLLAPPAINRNKAHKRTHTRKIRVGLSGMKKRLTRAKHIHRDSQEKSIEDIRKLLEEAKLVRPAKPGKQVPEDVLRNIYKDYLILRNKAL